MPRWSSVKGNLKETERLVRHGLVAWPRFAKQAAMVVADTAGVLLSIWVASWLLSPELISAADLLPLVATTLLVTLLVARHLSFYHSIVRYLGMGLAVASIKVAIASVTALALAAYFSGLGSVPIRLAIIYGAFFGIYLVGSRYLAQHFLVRRSRGKEKVIVYGAGEAGAQVARAMQDGKTFSPVAFIDDDRSMQGKQVSGVSVYGLDSLESLIEQFDVSRLLLAMPSISRNARREIISVLEPLAVHVQTIPDINDLITGRARVDEFRDVDVSDLLGRDAVPPDDQLLRATITDKSVMVTGAGGSIGSELCRQILALEPKRLVLFERSEFALYQVNSELETLTHSLGISCEIKALLGSACNQERVREVMQTFEIETLYHAAAYKHVPLVEHNNLEGVHNNIFGTLYTAIAAAESGVETFVLISTDKAVSPTNVMGATKRFAEMVLQAMQGQHSATRFCMVRFGNVLESSGSVVPLFREQIRAGGPVTVTHRDIIRYFMTIPEAAQLVIQAGAMAGGGEVFVLDMGEPVRILDLAKRMINLMGMTAIDEDNPDGDIEIQFTGLRPAEKLYEELLIGTDVAGTAHPRILRANEEYLPMDSLQGYIDVLTAASEARDRDMVREVLLRSVSGYAPTNGIDDLVHMATHEPRDESPSDKVISLTSRRA
jgi:FlaA1/EpsC-like NDP-sugar epimerase